MYCSVLSSQPLYSTPPPHTHTHITNLRKSTHLGLYYVFIQVHTLTLSPYESQKIIVTLCIGPQKHIRVYPLHASTHIHTNFLLSPRTHYLFM